MKRVMKINYEGTEIDFEVASGKNVEYIMAKMNPWNLVERYGMCFRYGPCDGYDMEIINGKTWINNKIRYTKYAYDLLAILKILKDENKILTYKNYQLEIATMLSLGLEGRYLTDGEIAQVLL